MIRLLRPLFVSAVAVGIAFTACPTPSHAIDWRDAYTRQMEQGVAAYDDGQYQEALAAFQAALLENPNDPAAIFNRGLAKARLGDFDAARTDFSDASDRAAEDPGLRSRALYNRGLAEFSQAQAIQQEERERALELALDSNTSFSQALEANPTFEEAQRNREYARELIQQLAQRPPEQEQQGQDQQEDQQQQQDQQQDQQGQDQQQQGDQQQDQQDSQDQQEQDQQEQGEQGQQQQPGDQQQEGEQQSQQQQQDGEQEQQGQEQQEGQSGEENEQQAQGSAQQGEGEQQATGRLTPEDARRLLNLLGNPELLIPRLPDTSPSDPNRKEW